MVDCPISAYYSNSNPEQSIIDIAQRRPSEQLHDGWIISHHQKNLGSHPAIFFLKNQVGWDFVGWVVAIGALFGLSTSLLGSMFPLPRILVSVLAWSQKSYRPLIQDMIELKRLNF